MAVSKAQIKATAKYEAKTYDKTLIRLPKGRLDEIRAHIEPAGESLNGFIGRAISETMERDSSGAAAPCAVQQEAGTAPAGRVVYRVPAADTAESPQEAAGATAVAGSISLPPDTLETAQEAADFAMETVQEFISRAVIAQSQRDHQPTDMIFLPKDVVKDAFCGGFVFLGVEGGLIFLALPEFGLKKKKK